MNTQNATSGKTYRFTPESYKELRSVLTARKEAQSQNRNSIKVMHPLRQIVVDFLRDKTVITAHSRTVINELGKHYTIKW